MFRKSLAESLEHISENDRPAILAALVGEQLASLGELNPERTLGTIDDYYQIDSVNYQLIQQAEKNDINNQFPTIFCCYAFITDNINTLDLDKLSFAIAWLGEQLASFPEYEKILKSIRAIQNVRRYSLGEKVEIPGDCYLNLAKAVLPQADLSRTDLRYANLAGANLELANCANANMSYAILTGANANHADFSYALMEEADLSNMTMVKAILIEAFLRNANLRGVDATHAKLDDATLHLTDMQGATFTDASLQRTYLFRANMANTTFKRANLQEAMLDFSCLRDAVFTSAIFKRCLMRRTSLQGALLNHADLSNANMTDSETSHTLFVSAIMHYTCLQGVKLEGSLENADLTCADLTKADLSHPELNLLNTKLGHAQMDTSTRFIADQASRSTRIYNAYVAEKKAMFSKANFLSNPELNSRVNLGNALDQLNTMLEFHIDYPLLQECISFEFRQKMLTLKQTNPALASTLSQFAYTHPLFAHDIGIVNVVNVISRSVFGLFSLPGEREPDLFESESQKQMRVLFSNQSLS